VQHHSRTPRQAKERVGGKKPIRSSGELKESHRESNGGTVGGARHWFGGLKKSVNAREMVIKNTGVSVGGGKGPAGEKKDGGKGG